MPNQETTARLLGDAETPFSFNSAGEALKQLMDVIPKGKMAAAFGCFNELACVLADAQHVIAHPEDV